LSFNYVRTIAMDMKPCNLASKINRVDWRGVASGGMLPISRASVENAGLERE